MAKKPVEIKYNPDWEIFYEYNHGKDKIVLGDKIRFKGERSEFKFIRYVINSKTHAEWIDCQGEGGYRSFYTKNLKGKVKPKKFRSLSNG